MIFKIKNDLKSPKHRIYLKADNLLHIQPLSIQQRSLQPLQARPQQTLYMEAELPRWLWGFPDKFVPNIDCFPELAIHLAHMPQLNTAEKQVILNECKKWESFRMKKHFVNPNGFILELLFFWRLLENTVSFNLSHLHFLLGVVALGKRLYTRKKSAWLQMQLNPNETFFSMVENTQNLLTDLITSQNKAYFSYRLLQDAIISELFISWYLKPEDPYHGQGIFTGKQFILDIPLPQAKSKGTFKHEQTDQSINHFG